MGEQDTNAFETADEAGARELLGRLEGHAHKGALFADWARSYCSIELFKWLDAQISDSRNQWLAAQDREAAEAVRLQAQSYTKIKNWILAQVKAGEIASEGIKKLHEEGVELEGMVRPPRPE